MQEEARAEVGTQIDACFLRLNSSTNPHLLSEGDVRELVPAKPA